MLASVSRVRQLRQHVHALEMHRTSDITRSSSLFIQMDHGLTSLHRGFGRRCFASSSSDMPLHFDTHHVVTSLQHKGFSPDQSEAILCVMKDAMAASLEAQSRILATKSDHIQLKAELSERVFNSTLKFDIAQRHSRELLVRDFNTLKQDIRMLEKIDFDKIRMEIADLEKKFLLQKQAEDKTLNDLRLTMEKVETRMLQYAVGFAGTIMAVGAALLRLVL